MTAQIAHAPEADFTHDPRADATPSQLRWADERKARQARFVRRSLNATEFTPADKTCHAVKLPREPDLPEAPPAPPKEPWFFIVYEMDAIGQRPRVEDIIRIVARYYNVARDEILSARRTASIVRPRQVAMYLARFLTLKSLPEIGRHIGDRDHTTILSGVNKIARLRKTDPGLSEDIDTIAHALGGVVAL